jgi:hypothetical protein
MTFAEHINRFNRDLRLEVALPDGVEVMNPFDDPVTRRLAETFYLKFYSDNNPRQLVIGINPGRLGGGVTGIPFTDPVKLQDQCGIPNELRKVTEPSAGFIYDMINAFGGADAFYARYFIYAVSPLGFTKEGLNYNYYDSKTLEKAVTPFIISSMRKILHEGVDASICYCLGNGKNFKFLDDLNRKEEFFGDVVPLPHPRWIVQYRRKRYAEFIGSYLDALD